MKATSVLLVATILGLSLPAKSQELPFCYAQTATGQVVNLDSLCRPSNANANLPPDQAFQQLILKEATPSDKEFLQSQAGMEDAIAKAKQFCSGYNHSLTKEQIFEAIAQESFIGGGSPKLNSFLDLINTVGTRVYCPSFSATGQG